MSDVHGCGLAIGAVADTGEGEDHRNSGLEEGCLWDSASFEAGGELKN